MTAHEPNPAELWARIEERDRHYIERIDALATRIEQRFDAEQRALTSARETIDHRLLGMNEFREQITKERGNFINRDTFDARMHHLDSKFYELDRSIQTLQNKMATMHFLGGALVVAIIGQLVSIFWPA